MYGLAPTEIIYKIATNYILGFDEEVKITKHNFRQVDALPYAKDGTLQQVIDELYGDEAGVEAKDTGSNKASKEIITRPKSGSVIGNKDIISLIDDAGIEYVDLSDKNGALWIVGGKELQEFADSCNRFGYEFAFVPTGGKATDHRPGWWLKRGGK